MRPIAQSRFYDNVILLFFLYKYTFGMFIILLYIYPSRAWGHQNKDKQNNMCPTIKKNGHSVNELLFIEYILYY